MCVCRWQPCPVDEEAGVALPCVDGINSVVCRQRLTAEEAKSKAAHRLGASFSQPLAAMQLAQGPHPCASGAHDCHPDATCLPTKGLAYECACSPGFAGDGRSCGVVADCQTSFSPWSPCVCPRNALRYPTYKGEWWRKVEVISPAEFGGVPCAELVPPPGVEQATCTCQAVCPSFTTAQADTVGADILKVEKTVELIENCASACKHYNDFRLGLRAPADSPLVMISDKPKPEPPVETTPDEPEPEPGTVPLKPLKPFDPKPTKPAEPKRCRSFTFDQTTRTCWLHSQWQGKKDKAAPEGQLFCSVDMWEGWSVGDPEPRPPIVTTGGGGIKPPAPPPAEAQPGYCAENNVQEGTPCGPAGEAYRCIDGECVDLGPCGTNNGSCEQVCEQIGPKRRKCSCRPGYNPDGPEGTRCRPVTCGDPPAVPKESKINVQCSGYEFSQSCRYTCEAEHLSEKLKVATCGADGQWEWDDSQEVAWTPDDFALVCRGMYPFASPISV